MRKTERIGILFSDLVSHQWFYQVLSHTMLFNTTTLGMKVFTDCLLQCIHFMKQLYHLPLEIAEERCQLSDTSVSEVN